MNEKNRKPTAEELDRLAAHLDQGAPPETAAGPLAQQVRRDLLWLEGQLDVNVDDAMLLRVNARMADALRRRQHRWLRITIPAALAAGIAVAAILISALTWRPVNPAAPQQSAAAIEKINQDAQDALGSLDGDMVHLVARLATAQPDELDLQFATGETGEEDNALTVY